jgi:hypothetical protein
MHQYKKDFTNSRGERLQGPLVSPSRRGLLAGLKALVWFWIIDETYVLTFVMRCDMTKVGEIQMFELGDTQVGPRDGVRIGACT